MIFSQKMFIEFWILFEFLNFLKFINSIVKILFRSFGYFFFGISFDYVNFFGYLFYFGNLFGLC
jgi:hypothetical protein